MSTPAAFLSSTLGMRRLAGGILWIQAMQYYGTRPGDKKTSPETGRRDTKKTKQLYPELKNYWQQIIRIDPYMASAYLTGPTTLGWNLQRYEEAMALISEGIAAVEEIINKKEDFNYKDTSEGHLLMLGKKPYLLELRDKLYILQAVIVFLQQDKFSEAIEGLELIAEKENTPEEVKIMLAQIYEENALYEKAVRMWLHIYETAERESSREIALRSLKNLKEKLTASD
ncbi:MAG: hypothetical protein ACQESB_01790 [Elusimicrobiota bacterium]